MYSLDWSVAVLNQNCTKILRNTTKHNTQTYSKLLAPFDFRSLLNWRLNVMSVIALKQFSFISQCCGQNGSFRQSLLEKLPC